MMIFDDSYKEGAEPSCAEILNLQVVNQNVDKRNNNYIFTNNIINFSEPFYIRYDLKFYTRFDGHFNSSQKIVYFIVPRSYVDTTIIPLNENQYLLLELEESQQKDFTKNENINLMSAPRLLGGNNPFSGEIVIDAPEVGYTGAEITPGDPRNVNYGSDQIVSIAGFFTLSKTIYKITIQYDDNSYQLDNQTYTYEDFNQMPLDFNSNLIPLIPCALVEGNWGGYFSHYYYTCIFCDTYGKKERSFAMTNSLDITTTPTRLCLGQSTSYNYTKDNVEYTVNNNNSVNDLENSSFVYLTNSPNTINIKLSNNINGDLKINVLNTWNINVFQLYYPENLTSYLYKKNTSQYIEDPTSLETEKQYYYELKSGNNYIWRSNFFTLNKLENQFNATAIRYYVSTILKNESYVRISSNSSPYILLKIKGLINSLDKFTIKMGTSIEGARGADPFYINENTFQQEEINFLVIRENIDENKKIIKNSNLVYFIFNFYVKGSNDEYTELPEEYAIVCNAQISDTNSFNVERYGVSIGKRATGTSTNPRFEIENNYNVDIYGRTDFYGQVHFHNKPEIFPIGAIYLSASPENPGAYFYGEWIRWGKGRMPISIDENNSTTNLRTAEQIGGAQTVTLKASQMPKHRHTPASYGNKVGGYNTLFTTNIHFDSSSTARRQVATSSSSGIYAVTATNGDHLSQDVYTSYSGNTKAHNNMPPYITCYMWKRIS